MSIFLLAYYNDSLAKYSYAFRDIDYLLRTFSTRSSSATSSCYRTAGMPIYTGRRFYLGLTCFTARYGLSEGSPSEAGMRSDAQLALDYIKSHPLLENTKVILYGQSIGGAVSVDLAATNPDRIAGVILENTFLNLVGHKN